jgi:hypothetical protein
MFNVFPLRLGSRRGSWLALAALALLIWSAPTEAAPISPGCLPSPLPEAPGPSAVALDTVNFGEGMHLNVWRQACLDGTGSAVLMRVSPTASLPFLCSGDFALGQGGLQHNAVLLVTLTSARLCADLFAAATVIVDGALGAFDREQAFTLAFTGWDAGGPKVLQVSVPSAADVPVTLAAAVLPGSRSVQVDTPATVFATLIASGLEAAQNCMITHENASSIPASFQFWMTNPSTNQVIGGPNTAVSIPAGSHQTFLLAFTPSGPFSATAVQIKFDCVNTPPAPFIQGVNTLLLSAATEPVPDIIALAATATNDGIVNVPGASGTGAFAVATVNVGAGAQVTAIADTGSVTIPVTLSVCRTDPGTGQCISEIGSTVTIDIGQNQTPTFSVFVKGNGSVPFDPGRNRAFVRFEDATGVIRGTTSVAVRTQ